MLSLAFWGRPAGRPVSAPLRERAAPPLVFSPARGPPIAAPHPGPGGPGRIFLSPSSLSSAPRPPPPAVRAGPAGPAASDVVARP